MAQDLALAQSHAFSLSRILMVPVTLFKSGDEFGILPSDELDDEDDLEIVHEYFPRVPAAGDLLAAREAPPRPVQICTLIAAPLPPPFFAAETRMAAGMRTGKEGRSTSDRKTMNREELEALRATVSCEAVLGHVEQRHGRAHCWRGYRRR